MIVSHVHGFIFVAEKREKLKYSIGKAQQKLYVRVASN